MRFVGLFIAMQLVSNGLVAQEVNNYCSSAIELCPNVAINSNNIGANSTTCPGCEDDFKVWRIEKWKQN